jgi:hypothetical protein
MSAYARLATASALAVSFALTALPAVAADLYEPPYNEYGEGPPPPPRDRYAPDDDYGPQPPPRLVERGCVPRELARDRLRDAGWYDFHGLEPRGEVVLVQARRPSGRLFNLTIDRCSGRVVDARPAYGGGSRYYSGGRGNWDSFAWGPRRQWAPY